MLLNPTFKGLYYYIHASHQVFIELFFTRISCVPTAVLGAGNNGWMDSDYLCSERSPCHTRYLWKESQQNCEVVSVKKRQYLAARQCVKRDLTWDGRELGCEWRDGVNSVAGQNIPDKEMPCVLVSLVAVTNDLRISDGLCREGSLITHVTGRL